MSAARRSLHRCGALDGVLPDARAGDDHLFRLVCRPSGLYTCGWDQARRGEQRVAIPAGQGPKRSYVHDDLRERAQTLALDIVKNASWAPHVLTAEIGAFDARTQQQIGRPRTRARSSAWIRALTVGTLVAPARHVLGSSKVIVARRKPSSSNAASRYLFTEYGMRHEAPPSATGLHFFGRQKCYRLENRLQQIAVRARLRQRDEGQARDRAAEVRIVIDAPVRMLRRVVRVREVAAPRTAAPGIGIGIGRMNSD